MSRSQPPFSEKQAREAVAAALCWADALRALGYRPIGHNYRTLQHWVERWGVSTEHFDAALVRQRLGRERERPIEDVLVKNCSYNRGRLKRRLYREGYKERRCEECGQGETWHGQRISLILDHINGVGDDNRIENLRIVCPNCAAGLDTHCGRNLPRVRRCAGCGVEFEPVTLGHRHCSSACNGSTNAEERRGRPLPQTRKVERPPYEQLLREIEETSFLAVGRKYGVSDNAVRKWLRFYERQFEREREEERRRRGAGGEGADSEAA